MNVLSIVFEEWFHPEFIEKNIASSQKKFQVINGIDKILELLRKNDTYATFFVVGELLEHKQDLLDKILEGGHEIGFHTMNHSRLDSKNFQEKFEIEIKKFSELTNRKSKGFRAPSFSLKKESAWLIDILVKNNYKYDSSVFPVKTRLYGMPNAEHKPYKISSQSIEKHDESGKLLEFPLLTKKILGYSVPMAGGFYLRAIPMKFIEKSIINVEKSNFPAIMYVHSWELTPEYMPKISLPFFEKFVTYHNINKTLSKIEHLIRKFEFTSFERYMNNHSVF